MLLQRKKKKELWRYASKNFAQTDDGVQISQQQQQHHLQHRRHHHPRRRMSISSTSISLPTNCFNTACTSTDLTQLDLIHCNTPPPPYSVGVYGMDYSGHSLQKHRTCAFPCQREQSQSGTFAENSEPHIEQSDYSCDFPYPYSNGICNSYEDFRLAHCEHSSESLKNYPVVTKQHKSTAQINTSPALPSMQPTQGNNFASTAVNVFRTCCGCGFSSDSSTASILNNVNAPSISLMQKKSKYHSPFDHSDSSSTMKTEEVLQDFNSLMKQLKTYQIDALLKAVKSRKSPSLDVTTNGQHKNCILVKRNSNAHEDLQLKTCRLFFWSDIVSISELKRSPVCPSAHDTIYMCCNPLHWCRIVPKGDIKMHSSLWVRLPESQTTVSTDRLDRQTVWCEVAYWELAQRIGTRFKTKNTSFNIYNEGLQGSGFNEDMCLQNITKDKNQSTTPDVHNTRQKIGLGLTISRENDGIWLYNRSAVAIFLSSPSIKDSFSRAFKVMPGDCLKAFDSIKAQTFDYPSAYYPSAQLGPIDNNSMRISFVKGWGVGYKRQDITRCPCWLEVIFKQQR